jgi:hypothetical protein
MRAATWHRICKAIDERQWAIKKARGMQYGASPGIAVLTDPLALEWQWLENLKMRVGLHYCQASDSERGMKHGVVLKVPVVRRPR